LSAITGVTQSVFNIRDAGAPNVQWPRITIVTAVRNGARYIEDTIRSVISQGYPNLEYMVVDGVSADGTLDIIQKYKSHIAWWVSQPDKGVYDALNTGFARSTGEIMGWLNASDQLHVNSLFVVGSVFATLPSVEWITGRPTIFSPTGMTVAVNDLPHWARYRFLAGANRCIQQESTFWRRSLWERAGARLDSSYRDAGDCELWVRFFRYAELHPVDALIGGYRYHTDAISWMQRAEYDRHFNEIVERELNSLQEAGKVKFFRRLSKFMQRIPQVRGVWLRTAIRALYGLPWSDWPPVIEYQGDRWGFRSKRKA
jgi:glycosyltransferase involved in cell wall biosynthesis